MLAVSRLVEISSFFLSSGGRGKINLKAHHTPAYSHARRVSIHLNCVRNPAGFLACPSVPVIAIARAVLSLPAVPVTILRQRKPPLCMDA